MAKRMRVFYDTEFLEDGKTIDLISIGMIREDGKEFYAVSSEFDTSRVAYNNWLMQNVMNTIPHTTGVLFDAESPRGSRWMKLADNEDLMTREQIRDGIVDFVSDIWPEFWAWYGAYDHVALCQLFGAMVDLPKNFPMFTADIKQLHKAAGSPAMPQQPEGKHNALDDARFNIVRYDFLRALTDVQNDVRILQPEQEG
jgi:hypothetical protein